LLLLSLIIIAKPVSATDLANTWLNKASMPQSELGIRAVAVNGLIYVIGSSFNFEYNISTDSWTAKTPMPTPRGWFAIATYQNMIYVIGGRLSGPSSSTNEVYDPSNDSWKTLKPMPRNMSDVDAQAIDGKIYVLGTSTEVYDIEQDSWTEKTPMPFPVYAYASSVIDKEIYVIGGLNSHVSNKTQIYHPESDSWNTGSSPQFAVYNAAASATTGIMSPKRIYVFGGQMETGNTSSLEAINLTQSYDPRNDTWIVGASMPTARLGMTSAVVDDKIYVIGGSMMAVFSPVLKNNEVYLPFGYGNPEPSQGGGNPVANNLLIFASIIALLIGLVGVAAYVVLFRRRQKTAKRSFLSL
jgi:N-acetylneuraminic acid mutarotase